MATNKRNRDDDIKRKKMARTRFRNTVRTVMFNRIWLADTGEQKLSLNVKKNIALLVRPQRKVGLLTMVEKSLLRTHPYARSIEDRKKLVTMMSGLTCFAKIPPKIRARLVSALKFLMLGPGRVIMKEGYAPITLYFLLSGEVEVTKKVFDQVKNTFVEKVEHICGPGDCLGDVELLENCNRLNTYTTTGEVELLVLFDDDFDPILRPLMEKQWMDRKRALQSLEYFSFFNYEQTINACKLGTIRQFDPLETIYYEDKGHVSYVHFVLSGECVILQCLKMKVTQKKEGKLFELVDIANEQNDNLFQDLTNQEMMKMLKEGELDKKTTTFDIDREIASIDTAENQQSSPKVALKTMDIRSIEISCGLASPSSEKFTTEATSFYVGELEEQQPFDETSGVYEHTESIRTMQNEIKQFKLKTKEHIKENIAPNDNVENADTGVNGEQKDESPVIKLHKDANKKKAISTKVENHFIDVGSLTFGGIFGLGEKFEQRVIMARTTVQCLMLPRYWLLEKDQNPGEIWQRRRFYLDTTIPSRDFLFKDFLTTQKWQKFKHDLVQSNVQSFMSNPTKIQDIPIISRIVEACEE